MNPNPTKTCLVCGHVQTYSTKYLYLRAITRDCPRCVKIRNANNMRPLSMGKTHTLEANKKRSISLVEFWKQNPRPPMPIETRIKISNTKRIYTTESKGL